MQRTGRYGNTFIGLALLTWYVVRQWAGDQLLVVRLFNHMLPWLLLALIALVAVAGLVWKRGKWWWFAVILILLTARSLFPLFVPRLGAESVANESFRILSFNVCRPNRKIPPLVDLIQSQQPDLVLLQDVNPDFSEELIAGLFELSETTEGNVVYDRMSRQLVFSRFPLTSQDLSWGQGKAQKVVVHMPAGSISVWNVHVSKPLHWDRHYAEFTALADAIINEGDGPLIVAGDFNTTDQSKTYRMLTPHLKNAHWEVGWGFGFTFPAPDANPRCRLAINPLGLGPVVRIDHIFYSEHFFAHHARTLNRSGGSDHLPVVADLSLRGKSH